MKFSYSATIVGLLAVLTESSSAALIKRSDSQKVLTDKIWTSTSSGRNVLVTPTAIDGVTISGSPVTASATPWNSLDSSGIPYRVTPTVSDGTTTKVSPTPTASDYPEPTGGAPPVLGCINERVPSSGTLGYPFCIANGTELVVGETYWITWDPTYWGGDIDRVRLQTIQYPIQDNDDALFTSDYISNNNGFYPWLIKSSYKAGEGYFWLTITPLVTSQSTAEHVGTKSGPLLRIIDSVNDATTKITRVPSDNGLQSSTSSSSNKAKVIAPAVVVPVVAIIFIGLGIFYYLNHKGKEISFNTIRMRGSKKVQSIGDAGHGGVVTDETSTAASSNLRSDFSSTDTIGTNPFGDPHTYNPHI
ncbi:DEKNAAC105662 [Brettanomyces naardenensis]|uniref:DEKNAAC105662 n=1 Tax=Brettanomyces naardenensis TaxID=13370 RepID=A0A448YU62_BRENA|nr:DEKNAAC105662 [Brettanomyces naardenensis]